MAAALFSIDEVSIEITDAEGSIALVTILTPAGNGRLLGQLRFDAKMPYADKAHVEGLAPGVLGRQGINVILSKILVEANVEQVVIQGARRTTGTHGGQVPRAIIFPHRTADRSTG